jgi:hypothetical protein
VTDTDREACPERDEIPDLSAAAHAAGLGLQDNRLCLLEVDEKAEGRDGVGGSGKKMVRPSRWREMAQDAVAEKSVPVSLACAAFRLWILRGALLTLP